MRPSGCRASLRGPEPDDRGQLGPRPAVVGHARAEPRRAPRDGPVLRPLAEGHRERRRRGARDHLVRARVRGAGAVPGDVARPMARGECLSASGGGAPRLGLRGWSAAPRRAASRRCRSGRRRRRPARIATPRCRPIPAQTDRRDARCPVVGRRRAAERARTRPAPGRGVRPDLHLRAARRRARDPRRARGVAPPVGVQPGRDRGRPPHRRGARRHLGPGQRRDPQPDPSPVARSPGDRWSRDESRRSASSCGRRDIGSCQAIASGSPSPRPRGP